MSPVCPESHSIITLPCSPSAYIGCISAPSRQFQRTSVYHFTELPKCTCCFHVRLPIRDYTWRVIRIPLIICAVLTLQAGICTSILNIPPSHHLPCITHNIHDQCHHTHPAGLCESRRSRVRAPKTVNRASPEKRNEWEPGARLARCLELCAAAARGDVALAPSIQLSARGLPGSRSHTAYLIYIPGAPLASPRGEPSELLDVRFTLAFKMLPICEVQTCPPNDI